MLPAPTLDYGRGIPAEICLNIAERADTRALYSLSLVSKAWFAIADEHLWSSLPSLLPLLKLFPEDSRDTGMAFRRVSTVVRDIRRPSG